MDTVDEFIIFIILNVINVLWETGMCRLYSGVGVLNLNSHEGVPLKSFYLRHRFFLPNDN